MVKHGISLFVITIAWTVTGSCTPAPDRMVQSAVETPAFEPVLDAHLAAIMGRDLKAFNATLTSGDNLNVIFPNGKVLPDTQAVRDFHSEWFADKDWVMEPRVIKVIKGEDLATALLKYSYRDNAEGKPRMNWLLLVFKLENGAWKLVHDQNTEIEDV